MVVEQKLFPIQRSHVGIHTPYQIRGSVYMAAYEVYCHVYSPQEALITGWCRGGFSPGELVAFLYARSFPREEWSDRVTEAFKDMTL